jgi:large conductance mechanosensitive channel
MFVFWNAFQFQDDALYYFHTRLIGSVINIKQEGLLMWSDFKKFILRGNVIDLAVAVVIGAAFGAIVNSLVNDIVMPVIGFLTAGINFDDFRVILRQAAGDVPEVAITYGHLIQVVLQFIIIALTVFLVIRSITRMRKKKEEVPPPPPPPVKSDEVALLEEIRDLLKK